jgi:hypothetical protein
MNYTEELNRYREFLERYKFAGNQDERLIYKQLAEKSAQRLKDLQK